jgi:hypothetical protein
VIGSSYLRQRRIASVKRRIARHPDQADVIGREAAAEIVKLVRSNRYRSIDLPDDGSWSLRRYEIETVEYGAAGSQPGMYIPPRSPIESIKLVVAFGPDGYVLEDIPEGNDLAHMMRGYERAREDALWTGVHGLRRMHRLRRSWPYAAQYAEIAEQLASGDLVQAVQDAGIGLDGSALPDLAARARALK